MSDSCWQLYYVDRTLDFLPFRPACVAAPVAAVSYLLHMDHTAAVYPLVICTHPSIAHFTPAGRAPRDLDIVDLTTQHCTSKVNLTSQPHTTNGGRQGPRPPLVRGLAPTAPNRFLESVTGHLEIKFSDYLLVLCQKLPILHMTNNIFW